MMLALDTGILAEAISFKYPPLYNKGNLSLASFNNAHIAEAVFWSCSVKKVFSKILQYSQVFSLVQVFPVNFAKF